VPHLLRKPRLRATPSTEQKISIEAVGIRTERDGTGAHRRAEGGSDGRVEEPKGQGRVEGVVPAAGHGERGVEGGRFGDHGWGQRAGMGRDGGGGGGGGEDAAAEAAGGAPPPPHRSELSLFQCASLAGLGFVHFAMICLIHHHYSFRLQPIKIFKACLI